MSTEEMVQDQPQQEVVDTSPQVEEELDLELEDEPAQVTSADDVESLKAKVAELETKNKQLYARVKKAQPQAKPAEKINSNPEVLTRDEAILIAKGYSDEELKVLNKLKKAEPTKSLVELADDEVFSAWKSKRDKETRAEKAKLGASKGSSFNAEGMKPGMTTEEHKAYWEKMQK